MRRRARGQLWAFVYLGLRQVLELLLLLFRREGSKEAELLALTDHPNSLWVTQQARNVTGDLADADITARFLVRDRDTKYVASFDNVFKAEGAEILKTPFRTPNANALAERFVRTVRSECLDHLLVVIEAHLEHVLRSFARHYNGHRRHQGIAQEIPAPEEAAPLAAVPTIDSRHRHHRHRAPRIRRRDRLGELIHEYELVA